MSKIKDCWRDVKCLIIDEISMIDGRLFDKLVEKPADHNIDSAAPGVDSICVCFT
ncbi:hypothetical protein OF83DRAFT_1118303 [Amylostereum chailletii]|nr:hypothetical protein OF83DRAFT_1118303 [Amylostereum chailletii]